MKAEVLLPTNPLLLGDPRMHRSFSDQKEMSENSRQPVAKGSLGTFQMSYMPAAAVGLAIPRDEYPALKDDFRQSQYYDLKNKPMLG